MNNTMTAFVERLKTDKKLLGKITELAKARDAVAMKKFLLEEGVTNDDIHWGLEYNRTLHTSHNDGELSDENLEMIAGGKGCIGHETYEDGTGICLLMHNIAGYVQDGGDNSACLLLDVWASQKEVEFVQCRYYSGQ